MKLHRLIAAAVGGLLLAGASMAPAATVFTSSFNEVNAGAPGSGSFITYAPGASFGLWTVVGGVGDGGGSVDLLANDSSYGPSSQATPGSTLAGVDPQSVDLNGTSGTNPQGAIEAKFGTVAGQQYTLTFELSGNNNGSGFLTDATVITGTVITSSGITLGSTTFSSDAGGWTAEGLVFTANGDPTTIKFASDEPTGYSGPLLADVLVTGPAPAATVPMPASALCGSALLGLMFVTKMRSRKNTV